MKWERFLAVGETGVADPSICSAYCRSQRVFTISHSGLTITLARMRELPKLSRWKHHASGWEVIFLEPNTWETWAGFQPDPFNSRVVNQLQVGISQPGPHG